MQVYVKNTDSALAVPNPQLAAFTRVHLKPGESREVTLSIPERAFLVVDEQGAWIKDGTRFDIYAGTSQPDAKSAALTGTAPIRIEADLKDI